jgi:hypothetical protein
MQTTVPTGCCCAVTRAPRSLQARPALPTQAAAGRVSPLASVTWMLPPQLRQEGEQLVVAEAAIGEEGDLAPRRENLGEPHQAGILVGVALVREFVLPHRQPQQWRGAALAGDQMQGEGGLPVTVELGPVHGDQDRLACADHVRHPMGEAVPHIDALVAEQPVHLLDRVFGHQPARLRQRLTNH